MLKNYHRIILVLTLGLLTFGLAAHSVPATSICACVNPADNTGNLAPMDGCLACLLQAGICIPGLEQLNIGTKSLQMVELSSPRAREHPLEIAHPPTLA